MTVKKISAEQCQISGIHIKGNLINWENHTIPISGILRIWIGARPTELFPVKFLLILLFIALSGQYYIGIAATLVSLAIGSAIWLQSHRNDDTEEYVNIQLFSGDIISFSSDNKDTKIQFYHTLVEFAEGGKAAEDGKVSDVSFDTNGIIVEVPDEEPEVKAPGIMKINKNSKNGKLIDELQKLYQSCEKKTDANSEILLLINETARLMESDDRTGLKALLQKFVTIGLIGDCNELGLDALLQEIKSNLY